MRTSRRLTFRQISEGCRREAAERLWAKAHRASKLRHALARKANRAAKKCEQIKAGCILRAHKLLPEHIKVTIDAEQHVGLPLIHWKGHCAFHLPYDLIEL